MKYRGRYTIADETAEYGSYLHILETALLNDKLLILAIGAAGSMYLFVFDTDNRSSVSSTRIFANTKLVYPQSLIALENGFAIYEPNHEIAVFEEFCNKPSRIIPIGDCVPGVLPNGDFIATSEHDSSLILSNLFGAESKSIGVDDQINAYKGSIKTVELAMESRVRQYALYRTWECSYAIAVIHNEKARIVSQGWLENTYLDLLCWPIFKILCRNRLLLYDGKSFIFDFDDCGNLIDCTSIPDFLVYCEAAGCFIGVSQAAPNQLRIKKGEIEHVLHEYENSIFDVKLSRNVLAVRIKGDGIHVYELEPTDCGEFDRRLTLAALSIL